MIEFMEEIIKFYDMLSYARSKGYTDKELAYVILGTRSLTQAIKFVYLHMVINPKN